MATSSRIGAVLRLVGRMLEGILNHLGYLGLPEVPLEPCWDLFGRPHSLAGAGLHLQSAAFLAQKRVHRRVPRDAGCISNSVRPWGLQPTPQMES